MTSEKIKEYEKDIDPDTLARSSSDKPEENVNNKSVRGHHLLRSFLDDRARTVDFVCFLILLEMFTNIFITWLVFFGFVIKQALIFAGSFYIVAKDSWAEEQLYKKVNDLRIARVSNK